MTRPRLMVHSALVEQRDAERRVADLPPLPLSPVRQLPGKVDPRLWTALQRASHAVESFDRTLALDDVPRRSDASAVQLLCGAIQAAARGTTVSVRDLPDGVPGMLLLRSLRCAFLEELTHAGDALRPTEMVHVLRAIDTVEGILEKRGRLASPLTEADGRTLVVEVAHDMRSPLAAILFHVETIAREGSGPLREAQTRQLGLVYSAAFALSTLTNDLIEFARGGGALLDGPAAPFSIAGVLAGVRDIVLPIAEEKGLSVIVTPPDADWRVGHAAALHRVLLNLSTNALKFTDEGHVEVNARQVSKTAIEFSVADTGRGLPSNIVKSIRAPKAKTEDLGSRGFCSTGLGLSICRKLIEGMGGELHADSTPGVGSRFHFTIDLALAPRV